MNFLARRNRSYGAMSLWLGMAISGGIPWIRCPTALYNPPAPAGCVIGGLGHLAAVLCVLDARSGRWDSWWDNHSRRTWDRVSFEVPP